MEPKISLCMIVKDEEASLDKCLESVQGVADEMIIVDTGSTDSSADIARRHGARVLSYPWQNDFSEARNFALEAASGDWVLVLDADEELPDDTRARIKDVVKTSNADGFELVVRSPMPETDILKFEDVKIVRLFRNKKEFRYVMPIHEQIRQSIEKNGGVVQAADLMIVHHGYSSGMAQGKGNRAQRNLGILSNAVSSSPRNPYLHYQLGVTLMSMGRRDEAYNELKNVLRLEYESMGAPVLERFYTKLSQLALEKNRNEEAIQYARKSLGYNPANSISMYVVAVSLLSMNRISEGYEELLRIKQRQDGSLRLDIQLEHLIKACKELLGI